MLKRYLQYLSAFSFFSPRAVQDAHGHHPSLHTLNMAWRSHGATNRELIENLWTNKLIKDARVKEAFLKASTFSPHPIRGGPHHPSLSTDALPPPPHLQVDRAHYAAAHPYDDRPQSIGHDATISAPHMHASAVESLLPYILPTEANPAPRVLDIGSGSGYLTHVLAELVGDKGTVVGVEHIPELAELGRRNMAKSAEGSAFLAAGRARFRVGDGRKGWVEEEAREAERETVRERGNGWDAIHVGASAVKVHDELVDQLRSPGRLFIPVDDDESRLEQYIWTVDKDEEGNVVKKRLFGVRYVPLTDAPK